MSVLRVVARYLVARRALNLLTASVVALAVGLVVAVTGIARATKTSVLQGAGGYQLLVAAKGSPLQAVLAAVFFIDAPAGNLPLAVHRELRADPGVTRLVPVNLGDSYRGRYIVGTTPEYFALLAETVGHPVRAVPQLFAAPFDAVAGAAAARHLGLKPGDSFVGIHGFMELPEDLQKPHAESSYRVVGILEKTGTPADHAIFVSAETAWAVHGLRSPEGWQSAGSGAREANEVTALLVEARSYMDLVRIAATLDRRPDAQAVFPARVVGTLMEAFRVGENIALGLAWLVSVAAFFAVTISMLAAASERRRQLATLRALGAGPGFIVRMLLAESAVLGGIGGAAGLALGRAAGYFLAPWIERTSGLRLELLALDLGDAGIAAAGLLLGLAAGVAPAWSAYRQDVAANLNPAY